MLQIPYITDYLISRFHYFVSSIEVIKLQAPFYCYNFLKFKILKKKKNKIPDILKSREDCVSRLNTEIKYSCLIKNLRY